MSNNNTNEMFSNYPDVVDVSGLQSMLGGIGKQTAYELVRKGTIKAIKIGKLYRIPKINVIAFLTKNTV
ncbi:MAG: helix-turn-helix domain-containing protein [Clostridia bacterium]|mgnify:FL=1|jgi:DNA binding domain, excisionase family